jgi:hypothetical protein
MKAKNIRRLKNKFYIKHYIIQAGNNNKDLKKEKNEIIKQLEKLAFY